MFAWLSIADPMASGALLYVALFALAALDGVFPVVPSEGAVISVGVLAATGDASVPAVLVAAAAGAIVGDHLAYLVGHLAADRLARSRRRRAALARAAHVLERRGASLVVVSRYIPGGRTATTLAAGSVGYPLRTFSAATAAAGLTWATTSTLIGVLGGRAFEDRPLLGLALGLGVSLVLAAGIEVAHRRRSPHDGPDAAVAGPEGPATRGSRSGAQELSCW